MKSHYGNKTDINGLSEMTISQIAFIKELMRDNKPRKLVEVGVAAGSTSIVLYDMLSKVSPGAEMYSVDKSVRYYRDASKETGFCLKRYLEKTGSTVDHKFLLGKCLPEQLESIGKNVDFIILDTVHSLPGEILDFLAVLPLLKDGAIVVLHDVLSQHLFPYSEKAFSNQLLLDVVIAKEKSRKVPGEDNANIAAFRIDETTRQNIADVFWALTITWSYVPDETELKIYRNVFAGAYDNVFDKATALNRLTADTEEKEKEAVRIFEFARKISGKKIHIYGAGYFGKRLCRVLRDAGFGIIDFVVSDDAPDAGTVYDGVPIRFLDEIGVENDNLFILAVNTDKMEQMEENLRQRNINSYMLLPEIIRHLLCYI